MFTGIIEAVGEVLAAGERMRLRAPEDAWPNEPFQLGESIAVDGVCLTVTTIQGREITFDLSPETLDRTTLGALGTGAPVNLERAMRADGRFGGHMVQGHVDGVGRFLGSETAGDGLVARFETAPGGARYLVDKGSIAVSGVSLTVVRPVGEAFEVWLIPHTLEQTSLRRLLPGDEVNVEFDAMAKWVERLVGPWAGNLPS
ncbi:riboflavin synthase [bacterium]|nr:MAG: riboflavin synthase [bacterium]